MNYVNGWANNSQLYFLLYRGLTELFFVEERSFLGTLVLPSTIFKSYYVVAKNDKQNIQFILDGNWGEWSDLGCSRTCGNGTRSYRRDCNNPTPANGGKICVGESTKTEPCFLKECPIGKNVFKRDCFK
jgi:hypothetical protein